MYDRQYNAATIDTTDSSYSRYYPNHEHSLALFTFPAKLHDYVGVGRQTPGNYWPDIGLTALPCMCHENCSQLIAHETVTQSHGSQCQYHTWDNDTNCSRSRSNKPTYASLDSTTPYLAPLAEPASYPNQSHTLTIEVAQMQSNPYSTFAPNGSQAYSMSTQFIDTPYTDHGDLTDRAASRPQSSHVSTPNSTFSRTHQSQNFADGYGAITTPSSTVDSKENMQTIDQAMLIQQLGSGVETSNTLKRETDDPHRDWIPHLSSSQDQKDLLSVQIAQNQHQVRSLDDFSLNPSCIVPDLLLNQSASILSPIQVYSPYHNGMHLQNYAGMFVQNTAQDTFAFARGSDDLHDSFYADTNPFTADVGQNNYTNQSHTLLGEFDFNDSPLYPTNYYGSSHSQYNVPQPLNALPTQDATVRSAGRQLNKVRDSDRADLDEKLVRWRAQGITYKEIMNMGDWGLEESTLRGRHRTLTKPKEERVRKPQWDSAAVSQVPEIAGRY